MHRHRPLDSFDTLLFFCVMPTLKRVSSSCDYVSLITNAASTP